jgi:hypothetical protein
MTFPATHATPDTVMTGDGDNATPWTGRMATRVHPSAWRVTDARGLVLADWPSGAAKTDYTGWVNDTKSTTTLRFVGQDRQEVCRFTNSPVHCIDLDVLTYRSDVAAAPIKDEQTLAALPRSLPAAEVSALAANVLPVRSRRELDRALSSVTGPVPLDYTYESTATYRVEPVTGIAVAERREEIRTMHVRLPGNRTAPPIVIYDGDLRMACVEDNCAGIDVWNYRNRVRLWGKTMPVILSVGGAIGASVMMTELIRRRRYDDQHRQGSAWTEYFWWLMLSTFLNTVLGSVGIFGVAGLWGFLIVGIPVTGAFIGINYSVARHLKAPAYLYWWLSGTVFVLPVLWPAPTGRLWRLILGL